MRKAALPTWAGENSKPRVLVESEDQAIQAAVEHMLRDSGYAAATCGGPEKLRRRRCPLVTEGRCPLAEGADVVLHALNPDHAANAQVLRAIKDRCPDTPIVVEVPEPVAVRHPELLEGCERVSFPMTRRRLLAAVAAALHEPRPVGLDDSN